MVQSTQAYTMHHDATSARGSHAKQDTRRRDTKGLDMNSCNASDAVDGQQQQQQQRWMAVTIIEDDDLMFGGKPLCTWYEEDRRCSVGEGEESAPSPCSSTDEDEELHRGRQRVSHSASLNAHVHVFVFVFHC